MTNSCRYNNRRASERLSFDASELSSLTAIRKRSRLATSSRKQASKLITKNT